MTHDLGELARLIAGELAARDRAGPRGGPPAGEGKSAVDKNPNPSSATGVRKPHDGGVVASVRPPAGVTFVRDQARIADFIDHTLLKAEATIGDIDQLCAEAKDNGFAAVCVNPVWVPRCAQLLAGRDVAIATVIGFPLGANAPETKRREAERAVSDGATELDMVAAIGHARSGDWRHVADDIAAVLAGSAGRLVKVIIESAALTPVEIVKISAIAREVGAHYVKTSTGFHPAGGASAEAVALMRMVVGDALGVKASGGVRDCETALRMIASGATRIGTSSGVSMAKCLGPGPLPLEQLLTLAKEHPLACQTCSAAGGAPGAY